jgi:hypothetical protein
VIGVAQVINFTATDETLFEKYLQFCGIGLRNAQIYERSQLEVKRNQVLLDLAGVIFQEQSTLETTIHRILSHMLCLIQCERAMVLLVHEGSQSTFRYCKGLMGSESTFMCRVKWAHIPPSGLYRVKMSTIHWMDAEPYALPPTVRASHGALGTRGLTVHIQVRYTVGLRGLVAHFQVPYWVSVETPIHRAVPTGIY